jgi:hypothetical protein
LTSLIGGTSMALDPATGEIHVLVSDFGRIVYFHRATGSGSAWAHETLVRDEVSSAVIREDPASGDLLVVYNVDGFEAVPSSVLVMTRH